MKERLTEAAMDLIWANSYGATSVDAICERAGAKKGSFYYFFKSKSELAAAALEGDWKKRKADMDTIFSATVPPLWGGNCWAGADCPGTATRPGQACFASCWRERLLQRSIIGLKPGPSSAMAMHSTSQWLPPSRLQWSNRCKSDHTTTCESPSPRR